MLKRHSQVLLLGMAFADVLAAAAAWVAAYGLRRLGGELGWTSYPMPAFSEILTLAAATLLLTPGVFSLYGLYAARRTSGLLPELVTAAKAVLTIWGVTYFFSVLLTHSVVSRLLMGGVLIGWLVLTSLCRMSVRVLLRQLRKRGFNLRHASINGTGRLAQRLLHTLQRNPWMGIVVEFFIDSPDSPDYLRGVRVYHGLDDTGAIITVLPTEIVFVALPESQHHIIDHVVSQLSQTNAYVVVVPDLLSNTLLKQKTFELADMCMVSMTASPQQEWHSILKRWVDISGALAALLVLAAPMALIALIIKLTDFGPIFYRQTRGSLASSPFQIVKFRSMHVGADQQGGPDHATWDDPRATRIGRLLRRWSLDELPQLFNVLSGRMSLVGPRPEQPEIADRLRGQIPRYMLRGQVRPGITGLAQVKGYRGGTSMRKRIQHDLYYIRNWSLWLDLTILVRTLLGGFMDRGTRRRPVQSPDASADEEISEAQQPGDALSNT